MLIIGHRGAKGLATENTKESFQIALNNKVDAIEFDVQTTMDYIPVVNHDPFIEISLTRHIIAKTNFKDLKKIYPELLTLDEALRFINKRVPVIVEIKPKVYLQPVVDCIKSRLRNEWKQSGITISSFDFDILKSIKQKMPDIELAVNEKWSGVRAGHRARKLGTKYITMNERWLWSGFIKSVSRRGYKLSAYTVNDPEKAKKLASYGIYAVITDNPDKVKL